MVDAMEVPAPCPHCGVPFVWDMDFAVEREIAWQAPQAPRFRFRCTSCEAFVVVTFSWKLEAGAAPRTLRIAGEAASLPPAPRMLLVDSCPHGCGLRLALRLEPDDPWAQSSVTPQEDRVLGGYRCPRCDGEGRLRIRALVQRSREREQA